MFAETRPEAIEDMRAAADELRAELAGETVTFVVNRNINVSNVCIVGCAFCGFGQGKRSPDAYEHSREEFAARVADARRVRRDRDLHAVGHPPRLGARGLRGLAALRQGARARHPPARLQPDGGRAHVRRLRALAARGLRAAARGRARLDARHRRRGAPRRRARAHQPQQAAGRALGRDHRGEPPRGAALDRDGDVRPHRGAGRAGRAHARRARAAGAHRRLHRVRAALVHPVPHAARAARTGSRRSRARRTSSTPRRSGSRSAAASRACRRAG